MQARIAGALGVHVASAGAGGRQSGRSASDGGDSGIQELCAAEMAQVAPQLRALRIESEAPAASAGSQTGVVRPGSVPPIGKVRG